MSGSCSFFSFFSRSSLLSLVAALASIHSHSHASPCSFRTQPSLRTLDDVEVRTWTGEAVSLLDETSLPPPAAGDDAYRTWVEGGPGTDQDALLGRQRAIFSPHFPDSIWAFDLLLKRALGEIRAPRCLEALAFSAFNARRPLTQAPDEFLLVAMVGPDARGTPSLKLHMVDGSRGSVNIPRALRASLRAEARAGWSVESMGHNHPFFIGNHDVGGTVVPSEPDIEAFRNWEREFGTKRAWITNGFTVFSLSAPEFPLFSPPE